MKAMLIEILFDSPAVACLAAAIAFWFFWWVWSSLPERGWPLNAATYLIKPPKAVVVMIGVLFVWIAMPLFWRLVQGDTSTRVDDLNKLLIGFAGFLGLPFFVWRTWIANKQQKTEDEAHHTTMFKNAVDQLGAMRDGDDGKQVPNVEIRIGAIYALEKLARDYPPLHWQTMEILCAYVREHAKITSMGGVCPRVDVQTALTVIGRRSDEQRERESLRQDRNSRDERLNLAYCDLTEIDLRALHFEGANFFGSLFEGARFDKAHIEGAILTKAQLKGANFSEADVRNVELSEACLNHAIFNNAKVDGAMFHAADIRWAYLSAAEGLVQDQIDQAIGDDTTNLLLTKLQRPASWASDELTW